MWWLFGLGVSLVQLVVVVLGCVVCDCVLRWLLALGMVVVILAWVYRQLPVILWLLCGWFGLFGGLF